MKKFAKLFYDCPLDARRSAARWRPGRCARAAVRRGDRGQGLASGRQVTGVSKRQAGARGQGTGVSKRQAGDRGQGHGTEVPRTSPQSPHVPVPIHLNRSPVTLSPGTLLLWRFELLEFSV